jgi:Carboxypeptidase regulatory-like domain/TonB dependent receptor
MHRNGASQRKRAVIMLTMGVAVLLLIATSAWAQSFRGSIRGTVTDPSGSVIAGAKVTAKNIGTGLQREATTGQDGAYVLAELPAGEYTVRAESGGLSPSAQNVQVNVGLDTSANFDLTKVQKRQEELTVTEEAPLIETTRDVLGEVVERKLVEDLPLNGRDFGKLVALVPGATVEPSGVAAIQSGFGQFAINGNRDRSNNYTLDGTDNNDPFFNNSALNQTGIGGAPASLLPIDAIQEFNLQSQFPAEYGRNSGSVVNIVTKSGTNHLHGSAFEFLRNDAMDARNYFNRTIDPGTGLPIKKTAFRNNQFGGSLGAPIVRDKTFFFGAYEGQRERVGSDFTFLVPTSYQIQEAAIIAQANNGNTPVNPALTKLLGLFPSSQTGSLPGTVKDKNDVNSLIAKIDHQFSSNESLTARYAFAQSNQVFPLGGLGGGAASRLPQFAQISPTRVQVASASWLSTFSATNLNEVRFGYSRYRTSFSSKDAKYDPVAQLGIDFGTGKLSLPEIDFGGIFENLGATAFSIPRGRTSQSYQILDDFTWIRGRHTIKFGGEYRRVAIDSFNDNLERGQIEFGSSTFGPPNNPPNSICPFNPPDPRVAECSDAGITTLANFYLGNSYNAFAVMGSTQRTTYNKGLSFFAQDDFRVSSNLTLNYGVRWEYFGPISEAHNLLSNLGRDGQLAMVGTDGLDGAYAREWKDFGPRVGFAWNPHASTVLRGGYGLFYDYVPQDLLIANFTNSAGITQNPIGPSAILPFGFNPSSFAGNPPGPVFTGFSQPCPCDIFVTPRHFSTPYAQNWNLNLEQEVLKSMALQLGYVGSKGTKLVRLLDLNQPDYLGTRANANYGKIDSLAPVSASTYHAMQATVRVRGWNGISGFAGYTWSKSLDDASDGIDFNFSTVAFPQNSFNLHAEHGPSNFDTRHRFTAAFSYDVPKLLGPNWLSQGWQINSIVTAQSGRPVPIVSGNDTSGIDPNLLPPNSFPPTPSNFHQRPNLVPGTPIVNSNWESAPDSIGYLNGAAFAQPAYATSANPQGSFGNLGRNSISGPKFWNVDFSLAKSFRIFERLNLQLRGEFFNIFNHPNFALPNFFVNPGSTQQGLITQTPDQAQTNPGLGGGGPRVVQLGLKVIF